MPAEIDWEGLVVAFENRSQKITHFYDRQSGDVVQVLVKDADRHAALSGDARYAALPRDAGERSRGDLEDFAAHCVDASCRRDLEAALATDEFPSAYRAALLRHPKEEAHFFQYKEKRARERAAEWLKGQGIVNTSSS
jgi:Tfp pilus assembly protein FimV